MSEYNNSVTSYEIEKEKDDNRDEEIQGDKPPHH